MGNWRVGVEVLIGKKAIISKLNGNKYVLKARALKWVRINEGEDFLLLFTSFWWRIEWKFLEFFPRQFPADLTLSSALCVQLSGSYYYFNEIFQFSLLLHHNFSSSLSDDVVVVWLCEIVYTMHNNISCYWHLKRKTTFIFSFHGRSRMNVTMQGGQTLPGMQGTINSSSHMSGSSQLMPGFPLKSSQPYSPSR